MMIIDAPSPYYKERTQTITAIVIHDSDGHDLAEVLKLYAGEDAQKSMHYIIASDGNVIRCVQNMHRAIHVQDGELHGQRDVNDFSIGVTVVVDPGERDAKYSEEQFDTLITLVVDLVRDYRIPLNRVVGHDHVENASDPGEEFPWFEFLNSVGTIVAQEDITPTSTTNGEH